MNRDHSVVFEKHPCTAFQTLLLTMMSTPFLLRILGHSSRYNGHPSYIHPFQSILVHWFLKFDVHSCHLLFDHSQFVLIHGSNIQVPMQYCSLQHQTLLPSPVTFTAGSNFHFGSVCSFFEVISPLVSSNILGTYQPGEFIFQCHTFLPFHSVHGVPKARSLVSFLWLWFSFCLPFDG